MKSKKGFTLIELLAVIVILAIIALIATPIIIGVIDDARKGAFENTAYGVLEGLRLNYVERTMNGTTSEEQNFTFPNSGLKLSGEEPAYGSAKIDGSGNISFALADKDKRWCAKKEATSEKVTVEDYSEENCKIDGTSGSKCNAVSFATDSWETIACAVKNNELNKYKLGDEKEVTLTGEYAGTYTVRIANTSTPTECSNSDFSQSACGFVVEFKDIITTTFMNSTEINKGGWPASELYKKLNPKAGGDTSESTIYNAFPEDLKKVIADTKVISSHGSNDSNNFVSTDKLYLLATKEVYGKEGTSNQITEDTSDENTRQLDYYKSIGIKTNYYSGIIKQYQDSDTYWWLRSATSGSNYYFYSIDVRGDHSYKFAVYDIGISPAFKIG